MQKNSVGVNKNVKASLFRKAFTHIKMYCGNFNKSTSAANSPYSEALR